MHFDFMTPEIWNSLVIAVVLIGFALAIPRLIRDWLAYQQRKRDEVRRASRAASDESAERTRPRQPGPKR